jgi:hypothetical protein
LTKIAEIRERLFQLQGLAYLIRQTRHDEAPPLNMEDISYGVGLSLSKPIEEAMALLNDLEVREGKVRPATEGRQEAGKGRR